MNPLKIFYYHLYLLQLENYNLTRYMHALTQRYLPPQELRQKLVWTAKLKIITLLATTLIVIGLMSPLGFISLIGIVFFPLYLIIATLILLPGDYLIKKIIISRAKNKLQALNPQPLIIAITGSYGKTTMKEMVAAVLQTRYTVLKTPENINTPLGIARLILKKLTNQTHMFIVEMGAYQKGDIKALCAITPPDIAIITGINEAHLERFGTIKNTIATKCEIIDYAKKDALIIINNDNALVKEHAPKHAQGRTVLTYSADEGDELPPLQLLGTYAVGTARGALLVAKALNIPKETAQKALITQKPLPHRLEPTKVPGDILVIDDSYNGNPEGAHEAIAVLARYQDKRRIYITPGLVETGKQNETVHRIIGAELAPVANLVILIKNSATRHIKNGLLAAHYPKEYIIEFQTTLEAHRALPSILKSGDVILFQNDWPDNYL